MGSYIMKMLLWVLKLYMKYKMEKFDDLTLNINISKVYDRID